MGQSGDENDAFAVRQRGRREAADDAIEEVLILVEMHDVIARGGVRQKVVPRFAVARGMVGFVCCACSRVPWPSSDGFI